MKECLRAGVVLPEVAAVVKAGETVHPGPAAEMVLPLQVAAHAAIAAEAAEGSCENDEVQLRLKPRDQFAWLCIYFHSTGKKFLTIVIQFLF
jgi:hypothetical protein